MASNISNRISLDGGDDVRKQIVGIADEAERLFKGISSLAAQFGRIDTSGLDKTRDRLQQTAGAVGETSSQVQSLGGGLLSFASGTAIAIGSLALATGGILSALAKSAADSAAALTDTAQKVGQSVGAYQQLKQGADDAGISVEGLNRFLGTIDRAATGAAASLERVVPVDGVARLEQVGNSFQLVSDGLALVRQNTDEFGRAVSGSFDLIQKVGGKTITIINGVSQSTLNLAQGANGLRQGAGAAASALAELGLSGQRFAQLSGEDRLRALAEQLDKLPDGAAKASIAARLFGDEWRKALEFIHNLPATLDPASASIRKLGDGEVAAGKALSDALSDLGRAFDAIKNRVGDLLAPGRTATAEWLTSLIDGANKLLKGFIDADEGKKKLLEAGKFDLFKDLDFDKFRDFLNQSGSTGLAKALELIRGVSSDLATIWSSVLVPAGQLVIASFQGVADQINAAFGSDITGRFVAVAVAVGVVTGAFGLFRGILAPIATLLGTMFGSFGAVLIATGAAVRAFWTEFRAVGIEALAAVRAQSVGFSAALSQLMRGNFGAAWTLFKNAALDAFTTVRQALAEVFGGPGSAVFTNLLRVFALLTAAAAGVAAVINAIFGTNLDASGLLLLAIVLQLTGAFRALYAAGLVLSVILTPIGAALTAVAASAIILARAFPDLAGSWAQVSQGFSDLLSGKFAEAFANFGKAFDGVWGNLREQGALTWIILGAGAIALAAAVGGVATAVVGLTGKIAALSAILLPIAPAIVALATAAALAGDVTREVDPLQKKMQEINADFAQGKITLEEYNSQLKALGESSGAATSNPAAGGKNFADSWKAATEQVKAAIAGTTDAANQAAGGIVPPFKQAADNVAGAFKQAAPQAFNGFVETSRGVWQKIEGDGKAAAENIASGFKNSADGSFNGFREIAKGVWQKIPQDAKSAGDEAKQITSQQWQDISQTVTQSLDGIEHAFQSLKGDQLTRSLGDVQQQLDAVGQGTQGLSERLNAAFAALQSGGSTVAQQLQLIANTVLGIAPPIDGAVASAGSLTSAFDGAASSVGGITGSLDGLIGKLQEAVAAAQQLAQAMAQTSAPSGGDGPNFAAGGYTGHGGTWEPAGVVHRGEYVQPAYVVRQPGVLSFLELLRSVGGDLRKVFARFGIMPKGFALGGLVGGVAQHLTFDLPQFAGGGLVPAPARAGGVRELHPVRIDLGGRSLGGLFAPPDIVRELHKEAVIDRARSSRAPTRGSRRG